MMAQKERAIADDATRHDFRAPRYAVPWRARCVARRADERLRDVHML